MWLRSHTCIIDFKIYFWSYLVGSSRRILTNILNGSLCGFYLFNTVHEGERKAFLKFSYYINILIFCQLQVLCLVAMEKPVSLKPEHIRDEKVKVCNFSKCHWKVMQFNHLHIFLIWISYHLIEPRFSSCLFLFSFCNDTIIETSNKENFCKWEGFMNSWLCPIKGVYECHGCCVTPLTLDFFKYSWSFMIWVHTYVSHDIC